MTQPLNYQQPQHILSFPNRSGSIMAVGIILCLAGMLTGCLTAITPLALVAPRQPGQPEMPMTQVVIAAVMYGAITGILGSLGIGALMRRRWSRPLTLIFGTHWLIVGVLSLIGMLAMIPILRDALRATPNMPQGFAVIGLTIALGMIFVFLIVLPGSILLLIKSDDARKTLEHFDPYPRWTDRCPLKILGLSLTLFVGAAMMLIGSSYAVVPLFGLLLKGPAAIAVSCVPAVLLGISGYWVYKLKMAGWWLGLAIIVIGTLAMIPTFMLIPLEDYYSAVNMPPEQIEIYKKHATLARTVPIVFMLLFAVSFTIYMLRMKPLIRAASTNPREDASDARSQ